jgi:hypothetical protein
MGKKFPTLELASRGFCKFVALPKFAILVLGVGVWCTMGGEGCMRDEMKGCSGRKYSSNAYHDLLIGMDSPFKVAFRLVYRNR